MTANQISYARHLEDARHNVETERLQSEANAITIRGQDLNAATLRRGQDLSYAASIYSADRHYAASVDSASISASASRYAAELNYSASMASTEQRREQAGANIANDVRNTDIKQNEFAWKQNTWAWDKLFGVIKTVGSMAAMA